MSITIVRRSHCLFQMFFTKPGIAHEEKRKFLRGVWEILKVQTKICAIWSILEANLKKSSTLKYTMNTSFIPSICIQTSIILIYIEKKYTCRLFSPRKNFFPAIFLFSFPWESSVCDKFQALSSSLHTPGVYLSYITAISYLYRWRLLEALFLNLLQDQCWNQTEQGIRTQRNIRLQYFF